MSLNTDRVRRHTAAAVLRRIDDATRSSLLEHGNAPERIAARIAALDLEWDLDRTIEAEAAIAGLVSLALGASVKRELLALPMFIAGAVFVYALSGRYPLLPLFRRLGLRSAREIARERYAFKALRGDFADMDHAPDSTGQPQPGSTPATAGASAGPGLTGSGPAS